MDDRAQRGRGADARVLADQGARPALQRPPPRRQELPVPRRHRRRAVAAGAGDAGSQAQGHPLLRAVRPRLRHPRHPRRAAALVPDPHVQPGEVPAAPTPRPAVPALPHREVLGAVRRRDRGDAVPPAGRRAVRLPRRRHRRRSSSTSTRRCARRPPRWSSRRRPACATGWPTCGGRSSASRWWPTRDEELDVIGLADDELEASVQVFYVRRGPGRRTQGLRARQGRGAHAGRPGRPDPRAPVRRGSTAGRAQAGARARRAGERRAVRGVAGDAARLAGAGPGAPARRQARRCSRP